MLRGQVGTENFWKGIQLYYKTYRDARDVRPPDRDGIRLGPDLKWFFTQWLTRRRAGADGSGL